MSKGYQPLASYGASSGVQVQEARFRPGASDEDMIAAGRIGAAYIRPADGFQSLLYMHDGQAARVLSFWRDRTALQRFHNETRPKLYAYELERWPQSPWLTHLLDFRDGTAAPHFIGPRMTVNADDIVVWSPPAALLVCDMAGLRDTRPLVDWWSQAAPSSGHALWRDQPGFLFFSACLFDGGEASVYAGFQSAGDLDTFMSSTFFGGWNARTCALVEDQQARLQIHRGRLLSWYIKEIR
jgi:hypothetical protein